MLSCRSTVLWLSLALLPSCVASAQREDRTVSGTVTDTHHEPLAGAVVQVHSENTLSVVSYITQTDGLYVFKHLSADDDYRISATYRGMHSRSRRVSKFDSKTNRQVRLVISPLALKPEIPSRTFRRWDIPTTSTLTWIQERPLAMAATASATAATDRSATGESATGVASANVPAACIAATSVSTLIAATSVSTLIAAPDVTTSAVRVTARIIPTVTAVVATTEPTAPRR